MILSSGLLQLVCAMPEEGGDADLLLFLPSRSGADDLPGAQQYGHEPKIVRLSQSTSHHAKYASCEDEMHSSLLPCSSPLETS